LQALICIVNGKTNIIADFPDLLVQKNELWWYKVCKKLLVEFFFLKSGVSEDIKWGILFKIKKEKEKWNGIMY
jgi:hypothetical protein